MVASLQGACRPSGLDLGCILGSYFSETFSFLDWEAIGSLHSYPYKPAQWGHSEASCVCMCVCCCVCACSVRTCLCVHGCGWLCMCVETRGQIQAFLDCFPIFFWYKFFHRTWTSLTKKSWVGSTCLLPPSPTLELQTSANTPGIFMWELSIHSSLHACEDALLTELSPRPFSLINSCIIMSTFYWFCPSGEGYYAFFKLPLSGVSSRGCLLCGPFHLIVHNQCIFLGFDPHGSMEHLVCGAGRPFRFRCPSQDSLKSHITNFSGDKELWKEILGFDEAVQEVGFDLPPVWPRPPLLLNFWS